MPSVAISAPAASRNTSRTPLAGVAYRPRLGREAVPGLDHAREAPAVGQHRGHGAHLRRGGAQQDRLAGADALVPGDAGQVARAQPGRRPAEPDDSPLVTFTVSLQNWGPG